MDQPDIVVEKKKDAYYFTHDANASHDPKILKLRAKLGWEGYGLFWAFIEILRDLNEYKLPEEDIEGIGIGLNLPQDKTEQFINLCVSIGLLVRKDGLIYSQSLIIRMKRLDDRRAKLSEAGRKGGIKSSTAQAVLKQGSSIRVNKSRSDESKVDQNKTDDTPPPEEVQEVVEVVAQNRIDSAQLKSMELLKDNWNTKMPGKVITLNSSRMDHLSARMKEEVFMSRYDEILEKILNNDFLNGKKEVENPKWKGATFDWIIKDDVNYVNILEGRYDNKDVPKKAKSWV